MASDSLNGTVATTRRPGVSFAASLAFENVSHRYHSKDTIREVSLKADAGEVLCLLGPSGSGKTTLLRIAAGIEMQTGGRLLLNGREISGPSVFLPPEKRGIGLMFQDFALFPHMTIRENVSFGLTALPKKEALIQADAALERVGLLHYAERYPHVLSGGEQQRVAIARALAPSPKLLIADEPTGNLDAETGRQIADLLFSEQRERDTTLVLVTHDAALAARCSRQVRVRSGEIVSDSETHLLSASVRQGAASA